MLGQDMKTASLGEIKSNSPDHDSDKLTPLLLDLSIFDDSSTAREGGQRCVIKEGYRRQPRYHKTTDQLSSGNVPHERPVKSNTDVNPTPHKRPPRECEHSLINLDNCDSITKAFDGKSAQKEGVLTIDHRLNKYTTEMDTLVSDAEDKGQPRFCHTRTPMLHYSSSIAEGEGK